MQNVAFLTTMVVTVRHCVLILLLSVGLWNCSPQTALCEQGARASALMITRGCEAKTLRNFDSSTCESTVGLCNEDELRKLKLALECIEKLTCSGPNDSQFVVSYYRCEGLYSGTREKCREAVFSSIQQ